MITIKLSQQVNVFGIITTIFVEIKNALIYHF